MKKIIITVEEIKDEEGFSTGQTLHFESEQLTKIEILGLLRLYEQQTSLELLREGDGR